MAQSEAMTVLGLVAFDENGRKIKSEIKSIRGKKFFCVTIPKATPRKMRRAAKMLRDLRVVIPDECDTEDFERFGICAISSEGILYRLAFKLYMETLKKFKMPPMEASLLICATRFGEEDFKLLSDFISNARYISLNASNAEFVAEYFLENYGVAVSEDSLNANVIINMYEKNFSLHIINNGFKYTLQNIKISLCEEEMYSTHIKGIATALLQLGIISAFDIKLASIEYKKKFLDIQ